MTNGAFNGWTLTTNTFQQIETKKQGIISLFKKDDFLVAGFRDGAT